MSDRCYANFLGNCKGAISREHYISCSLLKLVPGDSVTIRGVPWLGKGESRVIDKYAFCAKVLCEHHNHELSVLDEEIGRLFHVLFDVFRKDYMPAQVALTDNDVSVRFNGRIVERWLLKMLCGAIAAGNWQGAHREPDADLVKTLFNQREWPKQFKLYSSEFTDYTVPENPGIDFQVNVSLDGNILQGIKVRILCYDFILALGSFQGIPGLERPSDIHICKDGGRPLNIKFYWLET